MNYKVFGFKIIQNLISHFWLLGVLFGISLLLFIFLFKEWWVEFKCGIQEERESTVTGGWGWTWVLLLCCWLVTWTLDTIVYWFSGLVWKSNSLCRIMLNDRTGTILNSDFFVFFWLLNEQRNSKKPTRGSKALVCMSGPMSCLAWCLHFTILGFKYYRLVWV